MERDGTASSGGGRWRPVFHTSARERGGRAGDAVFLGPSPRGGLKPPRTEVHCDLGAGQDPARSLAKRAAPSPPPRGRVRTDSRMDGRSHTQHARAPAHQYKTVARLAKRAKRRVAREHERSKGRQRGDPLGHRPRCRDSQGCVHGGRPEPGDPAPMSTASPLPPHPPPPGRLRASLGARRSWPASFPEVGSRPQSGSGLTGRAGRVPGARHLVPGPRRRAPIVVRGSGELEAAGSEPFLILRPQCGQHAVETC